MRHSVLEIELKNGAKGLLIDVPGASVTYHELNFRAGEYLVPKPKREVPHLMEHILSGGANETYPDRQVFQLEVGKNGAYTNAYTSYYSIGYVGETADFEWDRVLKLQLVGLAKPLFLQHEFDAEFGNVKDELTSLTNEHFRVLGSEMGKAFGYNTLSDQERVKLMDNVTREDLAEHYKATHFTKNLRFIVAGSLRGRRVELKKILEELELPIGQHRLKLPEDQAKAPKKTIFIQNETVPNIYLIVNTQYNDMISIKQDQALNLARIMLTETLYSKIFGQARDRGLVYHVSSNHFISSKVTEWWLSAQVLPQNAAALCDIVLAEIKKVQNGLIDEQDLEAARQYALGSFQRSLQTVHSVANAYSRYFFDGYIEDMKAIPGRIKSVKKHDLANIMQLMFSQNIGNIGVLGGVDASVTNRLHEELQPLWRH